MWTMLQSLSLLLKMYTTSGHSYWRKPYKFKCQIFLSPPVVSLKENCSNVENVAKLLPCVQNFLDIGDFVLEGNKRYEEFNKTLTIVQASFKTLYGREVLKM